jgi:hypothetical protein
MKRRLTYMLGVTMADLDLRIGGLIRSHYSVQGRDPNRAASEGIPFQVGLDKYVDGHHAQRHRK